MIKITSDIKKVLNKCDTICMHFEKNNEKFSHNNADIKLRFLKHDKGQFKSDYGFLECQFDGFKGTIPSGAKSAYFSIDGAMLKVLKKLIQKDYEIILNCYDNKSSYITDNDLHNDTLFLTIYNKQGNEVIRQFPIDNSITPNNSARPIKY